MANEPLITCPASIKKVNGTLRVWSSVLRWIETGKKENDALVIEFLDIKSQAVNTSSDKAMLRITRENGEVVTINFPSGDSRDTVKEIIAAAMAKKLASGASSAPSPQTPPSRVNTPPSASSKGKPNLKEKDIALRTQLLTKDRSLAALHREFVVSGKITEEEFWEPRAHLLRNKQMVEDQKRGRTTVLLTDSRVEPGFTEQGTRTAKITLTTELIHQIFVQYPAIHKAFQENVPDKISEKEFWTRYFTHRNRQSLAQTASKDRDEIFDGLNNIIIDEPLMKRIRPAISTTQGRHALFDTFLDLDATEGDNVKVWGGNRPDSTMIPGREKTDISLIRRLNRHSTSVLEESIKGKQAIRNAEDEVILDDLQSENKKDTVPLSIGDEKVYFTSQVFGLDNVDASFLKLTPQEAMEFVSSLSTLSPLISHFQVSDEASRQAMSNLHELQSNQVAFKTDLSSIPSDITSIQASSQEALRHFWSAYPPDTPQKSNKLKRVVTTLNDKLTQYRSLQQKPPGNLSTKQVEDYLRPTVEALKRALSTQ